MYISQIQVRTRNVFTWLTRLYIYGHMYASGQLSVHDAEDFSINSNIRIMITITSVYIYIYYIYLYLSIVPFVGGYYSISTYLSIYLYLSIVPFVGGVFLDYNIMERNKIYSTFCWGGVFLDYNIMERNKIKYKNHFQLLRF